MIQWILKYFNITKNTISSHWISKKIIFDWLTVFADYLHVYSIQIWSSFIIDYF